MSGHLRGVGARTRRTAAVGVGGDLRLEATQRGSRRAGGLDPEFADARARHRPCELLDAVGVEVPVVDVPEEFGELRRALPTGYAPAAVRLGGDVGSPAGEGQYAPVLAEDLDATLGAEPGVGECRRRRGDFEGVRQAAEPAPELPFDEPPLWLLNPPRPLPLRGDHLVWNDAELEWLPGEQRYSSHWWRPDPPVREYRTVRHPDGFCCRVFRDRRSGQWYLQGIF